MNTVCETSVAAAAKTAFPVRLRCKETGDKPHANGTVRARTHPKGPRGSGGESPSLRRDSSVRRQGADDGGVERCPAAQVRRIALDEICAAGVLSVGKT